MARHKHCEVIKAWAEGAEIQVKGSDGWEDTTPLWHSHNEYRIKPRTVKREGWVNVYGLPAPAYIWDSEEQANLVAGSNRITCIRIEWEETE